MHYNKKVAFLACCLGILLFGVGMTTLGSILPSIKETIGIDDAQAGTLFSILPFGILAGALFFGPICDRYGYKALLIICCILMSAGFAGIAFSAHLIALQLSALVFGIGGGAINGATSAAVADMTTGSKGGNLSLLGLFFGIGAWLMPVILASTEGSHTYQQIVSFAALASILVATIYFFITFPPAKTQEAFSISKVRRMIKENCLLFTAFFLFCQSSFEAIMNNWTFTFLLAAREVKEVDALYALSTYVAGYTIMRLALGTVLRNIKVRTLVFLSIGLLVAGSALLIFPISYSMYIVALVLIGAGLSGGFPLMLALVGEKYAEHSGTAFSFVFVVALAGNMIVNYLVGWIADKSGIQHLPEVIATETSMMFVLAFFIFRSYNKSSY
jgi:MFS family permease